MRYYHLEAEFHKIQKKLKGGATAYYLGIGRSLGAEFNKNRYNSPDLKRREQFLSNLIQLQKNHTKDGLHNICVLFDFILEKAKKKFYYRVIYKEAEVFAKILPEKARIEFNKILEKHKIDFDHHELMFLYQRNPDGDFIYHCDEMQESDFCTHCGQHDGKLKRYDRKIKNKLFDE